MFPGRCELSVIKKVSRVSVVKQHLLRHCGYTVQIPGIDTAGMGGSGTHRSFFTMFNTNHQYVPLPCHEKPRVK